MLIVNNSRRVCKKKYNLDFISDNIINYSLSWYINNDIYHGDTLSLCKREIKSCSNNKNSVVKPKV